MTQELNCSDGAKMLIERMQANPNEFWGSGSKWSTIMNQAFSRVRGASETHMVLTERDATALTTAYDMYVREPMLAELVIKQVMTPAPERKQVEVRNMGGASGSSIAVEYERYLQDIRDKHLWGSDPFSYPPRERRK